MKLGFVSPVIKEGKQVVELQKSEIEKMNVKWEAAAVLYVVGDTPTIAAITRFLYKDWCYLQKLEIFKHDEGYFVLNFGSIADRDEVICAGPHTFWG